MKFKLTSNIDEMAKKLAMTADEITGYMEHGLVAGMRLFEGKMIKTQLTGRPGLRRQTGIGAGDWRVDSGRDGKRGFYAELANSPRSWYLIVHQAGKTIPKRLFIPEMFAKEGRAILQRSIIASIKKRRNFR